MRAERDRYVAFAYCAADILLEVDLSMKVTFAGGATRGLMGCEPEDIVGLSLQEVIDEPGWKRMSHLVKRTNPGSRLETQNMRLLGAKGRTPPFSMRGYYLSGVKERYYLAFQKEGAPQAATAEETAAGDISGESKSKGRSKSGLLDADSFAALSEQRVSEGHDKGEDSQLTLVDIKDMSLLQKRLGEGAYKTLLQTIGGYLQKHSVDGDSAAQFDDERYGLIHKANLDIKALEKGLAQHTSKADPSGAGVEVQTATANMTQEALDPVDTARALVYTIKQFDRQKGGEFTIEALSGGLGSIMEDTTEKIIATREVISSQKFEIAFQPIIDLTTRDIHHFEVLARLKEGGLGSSPFEFIRFAEEVGVVRDFDMAICHRVISWLKSAREAGNECSLAVNLSGKSLASEKFVSGLLDLLKKNEDLRDLILFELTESANIENLEAVNNVIQTLRQAGHTFCLDDFGAGEAAFSYLKSIKVDMVKVDGSYVRDVLTTKHDRHFIKAISGLSSDLGITTIAEMIEDEKTIKLLRTCGVSYGQGYLFGRPSFDISDFAKPAPKQSMVKRIASATSRMEWLR